MDTIISTEILIYTQYPNLLKPNASSKNIFIMDVMFSQRELFKNVYIPALIKINEKKMYKKDTVEKCTDTIAFQGLLYASHGMSYPDILATISCNVEEASILQLGKFHVL